MKLQPLIDADVLRYEIGFCGEYEEDGEKKIREFDFMVELLEGRIKGIIEDTGATEPPILFLTGSPTSVRIVNRTNSFTGQPPISYTTPYREEWATIKPYKGTRKAEKPFHFDNLTAYILGNYDCRVAYGLEADDYMCIEQYSRRSSVDTIICSRDKDLRQCPGWQFGWECGKQPSFGPAFVDNKGEIRAVKTSSGWELKGVGTKWFFGQMLIGDSVDNIPGCPKVGPVKAMNLLEGCNTKREHELAVISAYKEVYGDDYKERLLEQSKLLWMIRELNEDGSPKHYEWKFDD